MKHLLLLAVLQGALGAQSIEGTWQGTLTIPDRNLEIRLAFKIAKNGTPMKDVSTTLTPAASSTSGPSRSRGMP